MARQTRNKTADYRLVARVMKAVAQPIRLAIVDALKDGERCVSDIVEAVGAERSNVSRHLAVLTRAGIVEYRKEGLMVYYALRTPCILSIFGCVSGVLEKPTTQTRPVCCCTD